MRINSESHRADGARDVRRTRGAAQRHARVHRAPTERRTIQKLASTTSPSSAARGWLRHLSFAGYGLERWRDCCRRQVRHARQRTMTAWSAKAESRKDKDLVQRQFDTLDTNKDRKTGSGRVRGVLETV